jgi:hypothetical protein
MPRHNARTDGRSAHIADVARGLAQFPFGIEEILFNNTALLKIFRLTLVEICPECRYAESLLDLPPEHLDLCDEVNMSVLYFCLQLSTSLASRSGPGS